jgi:hypothetical protein
MLKPAVALAVLALAPCARAELGPMCMPVNYLGDNICTVDAADTAPTLQPYEAMNGRPVPYAQVTINGKTSDLWGYLYLPAENGYTCSTTRKRAMIFNHGASCKQYPTDELAQFYLRNCYIFFAPHREGHGLNNSFYGNTANTAAYAAGQRSIKERQDNLRQSADAHYGAGSAAADAAFQQGRVALYEYYNWDIQQAIKYLRGLDHVDPNGIFVSGVSIGGIETLTTTIDVPDCVQAGVPFAPAAENWHNIDPYMKNYLESIARLAPVPNFLIQACGDHSLGPYDDLGSILNSRSSPNRAKLYSYCGNNMDDAHAEFSYAGDRIGWWTPDVKAFLNNAVTIHSTTTCKLDKPQPRVPTLPDGTVVREYINYTTCLE